MSLQIRENPEAVMTLRHTEALALDCDAYNLLPEDIKQWKSEILAGRPRQLGDALKRIFQIYDQDKYVGDITFTRRSDGFPDEVDILIFRDSRNRGYAAASIRKFLEDYRTSLPRTIAAVVQKANRNRSVMRHILLSAGFSEQPPQGDVQPFIYRFDDVLRDKGPAQS